MRSGTVSTNVSWYLPADSAIWSGLDHGENCAVFEFRGSPLVVALMLKSSVSPIAKRPACRVEEASVIEIAAVKLVFMSWARNHLVRRISII